VRFITVSIVLTVAACSSGNVHSSDEYRASSPPEVKEPLYNPYASYGSATATWSPPVADRRGTIVWPADPASERDRPPYELQPWYVGASPFSGTF